MAETLNATEILARCEQAVREAFEKRFDQRTMLYDEARTLVYLEQEIMARIADRFSGRAEPGRDWRQRKRDGVEEFSPPLTPCEQVELKKYEGPKSGYPTQGVGRDGGYR